jgi:hypothetical protein
MSAAGPVALVLVTEMLTTPPLSQCLHYPPLLLLPDYLRCALHYYPLLSPCPVPCKRRTSPPLLYILTGPLARPNTRLIPAFSSLVLYYPLLYTIGLIASLPLSYRCMSIDYLPAL